MGDSNEHRFSKSINGFDLNSYLLGINCGFAEVVGAGCKRLALSSPLTEEQFNNIWEPTKQLAKEYKVHLYTDNNFLETLLFDPVYTRGKIVILIVKDIETLAEYQSLKRLKIEHHLKGTLKDIELTIAHRLGQLLSYNEEKINQLLSNGLLRSSS